MEIRPNLASIFIRPVFKGKLVPETQLGSQKTSLTSFDCTISKRVEQENGRPSIVLYRGPEVMFCPEIIWGQ